MYYKDFEENILDNLSGLIAKADAACLDTQNFEIYCKDEEGNLYDISKISCKKTKDNIQIILPITKI